MSVNIIRQSPRRESLTESSTPERAAGETSARTETRAQLGIASTEGSRGLAAGASRSRAASAARSTPSGATIRNRLNDFRASVGGPYQVAGRDVWVSAPFRMNGGLNQLESSAYVTRIQSALGADEFKKIARDLGSVLSGKGTPEQVRRVTQALIDSRAFAKYSNSSPERAVRQMMWDHGVGLDCSGYVHHAFLASRGAPASFLGDPLQSGLQSLPANPAFRRIQPGEARSGDVMVLAPTGGSGHKVIVFDRHQPSPGSDLHRAVSRELGSTPDARIVVYEVDSSWGANGQPHQGGVKRESWAYDESTKRWAKLIAGERGNWHAFASSKSGPYDHDLTGIFRPKSEG